MVFHTLYRYQRYTRLCPLLFNFATLYPLLLSQILGPSALIPPFIPTSHPHPPPHPPPPSYSLPLLVQFTPFPTKSSFLLLSAATKRSKSYAFQYNAQLYYTLVECRFPLYQTLHPLSLSLPRCTFTFHPASSVEDDSSVTAPPDLGHPLEFFP